MSLAARLYNGEVSYDFLARRRRWYAVSGVIVAVSLLSLLTRGLTLSLDFRGGDSFQFKSHGHSIADARATMTGAGVGDAVVQAIGQSEIQIKTRPLSDVKLEQVQTALTRTFGVSRDELNPQSVGASWGQQITNKAIEGLVLFLLAVVGYISVRFEPKMAAAAIVALLHDMIITAGLYSLVGFEVSPSTVIALLTILGFSLYDTVVVFDKVRENTAKIGASSSATYSHQANLALNQTLMRSINTSLIALLPVAALLFVGAGLLGAGTLKDLALAQFVGLASGAYSSIFVATPLLAQLKEREPAMRALAAKVARSDRADRSPRSTGRPALVGATAGATAGAGAGPGSVAPRTEPPRGPATREPGSPMTRPTGRPRRPGGKPGRPSGKRKR